MKYHILTLGCPKNSVDSEGMEGLLTDAGHTRAADATDADVIIVNTCSFIAAAREETVQVLRDLGRHKRAGQRLIAAGCMAQSHGDLLAQVSGVDAQLSTQAWTRINEVIAPPASQPIPLLETPAPAYADWRSTPIQRLQPSHSAYLKISDGCNLRCAFCTIPSIKGDMASKPIRAVLGEVEQLVGQGVQEIVLVAQHLTDYGRDLGLQDGLATLLEEMCQIVPHSGWIRLMYAYPHGISERLIRVMAEHPQVLAYLDMPLQHAHPDTLRRMRRPPDTEHTRAVIQQLRAAMPDMALRSTFIVGYPGETNAEFKTLLGFLEEMQLDRVGAFRYSREPGTPAAGLPDQVRPKVIERRWHELMQLQQGISRMRNQRWVGRTIPVLIEAHGATDTGQPLALGRSFRDAPEIDGQVFVWGEAPIGQVVDVRITEAAEYDVWGTC
ncbi:MiaB-like tRNA modifying enzyme YliG [Oscillochloris trichoides DG-6]|uniref:Ribosomal protein uS12 methylthiotransferase RimO n=1 Tax=Oscillochloris trichoides DG-6 TaxID=765420 RepID=E1IGM0_9CHLR|nr:30S ribosomal protein S12 methylthiotransferase RimO [Oscillochloris trichoides]EFO79689.1 MiaB-like tRNA modifying enzyme YliG [Oscillochloris trichoides DG-6]